MVVIKIFVEGGTVPTNANAATSANTAALRQSFNQLINSAFPTEKVRIECQLCGSGSEAKIKFVKNRDENSLLLIDLDGLVETRMAKLTAFGLLDVRENVFFMVQAMESWLLSQPTRLQEGLKKYYNKYTTTELCDDPLITNIDMQTIAVPDKVLDHLLKNHFQVQKGL
jgi:hypothetical protein